MDSFGTWLIVFTWGIQQGMVFFPTYIHAFKQQGCLNLGTATFK